MEELHKLFPLLPTDANAELPPPPITLDWEGLGIVLGDPAVPMTWEDVLLTFGARIALTARRRVLDELHYTCSAGIGHNKVLAKLCSAQNKPNKQVRLLAFALSPKAGNRLS